MPEDGQPVGRGAAERDGRDARDGLGQHGERDVVEHVVAVGGAPAAGEATSPATRRGVPATTTSPTSASVLPATQWAAVRTRSGATRVPPQPWTSASHGTVAGSTGVPPMTAPAGAAGEARTDRPPRRRAARRRAGGAGRRRWTWREPAAHPRSGDHGADPRAPRAPCARLGCGQPHDGAGAARRGPAGAPRTRRTRSGRAGPGPSVHAVRRAAPPLTGTLAVLALARRGLRVLRRSGAARPGGRAAGHARGGIRAAARADGADHGHAEAPGGDRRGGRGAPARPGRRAASGRSTRSPSGCAGRATRCARRPSRSRSSRSTRPRASGWADAGWGAAP